MSETDNLQNQRIDKVEIKVESLQNQVSQMETESARLGTRLDALGEMVGSGFMDLKEVIVARAEKDEANQKRNHELALQTAKDKQALWTKIIGIIGTLVGLAAAGGGGAYYTMSDIGEQPAPASEARP